MRRSLLGFYAVAVYAFLHVPLLILTLFSFNESRFTVWKGWSLNWYRAAFRDPQLAEATANSLIIALAATVLATALGTACAYGLWKRRSAVLGNTLYLSLVTPEIVMGVALLAFFQFLFRFLQVQLGMHTVILAHVMFSIAYVVVVVSARLRTFDPALEEAALDLGATPWVAFRTVTLPLLMPAVASGGAAGVRALLRRLRDYEHGGGRGFRDAADGDLRHRSARREPGGECDFVDGDLPAWRADSGRGEDAEGMKRRTVFLMGLSGLAGCMRDGRPRLNVFNWVELHCTGNDTGLRAGSGACGFVMRCMRAMKS